ncbi:hypothetical protein GJ744_001790 [Endocarpon pusillum]|uniref:Uncharacterized protein n=1 Tax=Endocarpon pusillum TaxID=364733 RepID=A0A8H7ACR0_9EURO|nr:hypothetical protein GJ744_001790 [Endocarpon pusillum]
MRLYETVITIVLTVLPAHRIDSAAYHFMEEDAREGYVVPTMIALTKKFMSMISKTGRSPVVVIWSNIPRLAGYSPVGMFVAEA